MIRCPRCKEKFDVEDVAEDFDDYFDTGSDWDPKYEDIYGDEPVCLRCATEETLESLSAFRSTPGWQDMLD